MQEIRRFKPSTVSRRFSVAAGFYRTCVIDGIMEHSPAGHVRRPVVPAESPALGFTHLQFEALLTAAREPPSPCDFALVAMLGLLGLRIFEATGTDIADLGEEHAVRPVRGDRLQCRQLPAGRGAGQPVDQPFRSACGRSGCGLPCRSCTWNASCGTCGTRLGGNSPRTTRLAAGAGSAPLPL
jgi:site-specific recombinase XerD